MSWREKEDGPILSPGHCFILQGLGGHIVCHEQDDPKGQESGLFEPEYWVGPDIWKIRDGGWVGHGLCKRGVASCFSGSPPLGPLLLRRRETIAGKCRTWKKSEKAQHILKTRISPWTSQPDIQILSIGLGLTSSLSQVWGNVWRRRWSRRRGCVLRSRIGWVRDDWARDGRARIPSCRHLPAFFIPPPRLLAPRGTFTKVTTLSFCQDDVFPFSSNRRVCWGRLAACLLGGCPSSGASGAFEQNLGEPPGGRPSVRDTPQVAESDN